MAKPLQLSCIGQVAVNVQDLGRAVAFYRDVLGMPFLFEVPPKMAFFDCGGIRLMLGVPEEPEFDHPASILYYKVDDIQAAWEGLKEAGVDLRREPHQLAPDEGPRAVDGLLPRFRGEHARADERGPGSPALSRPREKRVGVMGGALFPL